MRWQAGYLQHTDCKRSKSAQAVGCAQVTQYFPQGKNSPAFKWKDYSPQVFQRLREIFGIDNKVRAAFGARACTP